MKNLLQNYTEREREQYLQKGLWLQFGRLRCQTILERRTRDSNHKQILKKTVASLSYSPSELPILHGKMKQIQIYQTLSVTYILEQQQSLFLIPFRFSRNGRNISYRHANRYHSTSRSTSGQISAYFGVFRPFRPISENFGRYQILAL